jgi:twitching motility two-component system response regulator PilH
MMDFFKRQPPVVKPTDPAVGPVTTVLVVDDSPTETMVFRNTPLKAGIRVETAVNGQEGVEASQRLLPDLILMDVIMPILNGFQATRMLQRDAATARIPVIMVTTKDQLTDRAWGLRQGAVDYLVKPVNTEALIQRIRTVLGA